MSFEIDTAEMAVNGERRALRRNRVFKRGTLTFNKGYGALECVVRNQSGDGAMLMMGDTAAVPAMFDLAIGDDAPRPAHLRWRGLTMVGVSLG